MSVEVICSCGEKFNGSEESVGKSAKCPRCGTVFQTALDETLGEQGAAQQGVSSEKKRRSPVLIVVGSILLVVLGIVAAIRNYNSVPPQHDKPIDSSVGPNEANVVPAWIVLSQFTEDGPALFSVDWSVQRGDLAENGKCFLVIELSTPKSATTRYLEFPLDIASLSGTVKAFCSTEIRQAEKIVCYIEQRSDTTTTRISGLLALNQTPNKSSEKSPSDTANSSSRSMDVIISNARIENGLLLVDYETLRDVDSAVLQIIVWTDDNEDYNQFQLIEGLQDHTGTIYLDTIYERLFTKRPLNIRMETYGSMSGQGEPMSNQISLY